MIYIIKSAWTNQGFMDRLINVTSGEMTTRIELVGDGCALRPSQLAGLATYFPAPAPHGASVRRVTNPGTHYGSPAIEVIIPVYHQGVVLKYEVKRYRLDKAVWSYVIPTWLLKYLALGMETPEVIPFESPEAPEGYLDGLI